MARTLLPPMTQIRRDVHQRRQHESARADVRVRQDEVGIVHGAVAIDEQIEIDDARAPLLCRHAPHATLDLLAARQQLARAELRRHGDGRIDEPILIRLAPGLGRVVARAR